MKNRVAKIALVNSDIDLVYWGLDYCLENEEITENQIERIRKLMNRISKATKESPGKDE